MPGEFGRAPDGAVGKIGKQDPVAGQPADAVGQVRSGSDRNDEPVQPVAYHGPGVGGRDHRQAGRQRLVAHVGGPFRDRRRDKDIGPVVFLREVSPGHGAGEFDDGPEISLGRRGNAYGADGADQDVFLLQRARHFRQVLDALAELDRADKQNLQRPVGACADSRAEGGVIDPVGYDGAFSGGTSDRLDAVPRVVRPADDDVGKIPLAAFPRGQAFPIGPNRALEFPAGPALALLREERLFHRPRRGGLVDDAGQAAPPALFEDLDSGAVEHVERVRIGRPVAADEPAELPVPVQVLIEAARRGFCQPASQRAPQTEEREAYDPVPRDIRGLPCGQAREVVAPKRGRDERGGGPEPRRRRVDIREEAVQPAGRVKDFRHCVVAPCAEHGHSHVRRAAPCCFGVH